MNNLFAFLPMRTANGLLGNPEALRAQLAEDSYLLFHDVLDPGLVGRLRGRIQRVLSGRGWLEPPTIPVSSRCLIQPLRESDPEYIDGYQEVQKLEGFHTLAHDPALLEIMRQVVGPTAFPHPLKIARIAFPDHYEVSTPPHQDFPNNQGTELLTAAWIPLMEIPPEMGGLAVLRGSHRWGPLPLARHLGAGNRCAAIPPEMAEECRWVTTEFSLGDLLVFPSMTVHASLHNASEFNVRLSVDYRYQPEGAALTDIALEPHFQRLSWDDVYAGWSSTELQYYWRDLDYEQVPFVDMGVVDRDLAADFSRAEMREIYHYHERVEARTKRRLEAMGRAPTER